MLTELFPMLHPIGTAPDDLAGWPGNCLLYTSVTAGHLKDARISYSGEIILHTADMKIGRMIDPKTGIEVWKLPQQERDNCVSKEKLPLTKHLYEVLREEIKQQEKKKANVKAFISAVKKYTDMQDLDASTSREFIDRIEVSHTDKEFKTWEITIVYNFIG